MAGKARDLKAAASRLTDGMRVREDDTVAPRGKRGGVKDGRTGGGKVKVAAYVPPEMFAQLEARAAAEERSLSWLVYDALRAYLAARG